MASPGADTVCGLLLVFLVMFWAPGTLSEPKTVLGSKGSKKKGSVIRAERPSHASNELDGCGKVSKASQSPEEERTPREEGVQGKEAGSGSPESILVGGKAEGTWGGCSRCKEQWEQRCKSQN